MTAADSLKPTDEVFSEDEEDFLITEVKDEMQVHVLYEIQSAIKLFKLRGTHTKMGACHGRGSNLGSYDCKPMALSPSYAVTPCFY